MPRPATTSDTFRELKRKARSVRARPRKARDGGAGVAIPTVPKSHIDSLASQNIPEKEVTPPSEASSTPESRWRAAGDIEVTFYCRPLNPRLLLIRTDGGKNGTVAVKPDLQKRFSIGKRIWVRPTAHPSQYDLAGRYSMWGKRVES